MVNIGLNIKDFIRNSLFTFCSLVYDVKLKERCLENLIFLTLGEGHTFTPWSSLSRTIQTNEIIPSLFLIHNFF